MAKANWSVCQNQGYLGGISHLSELMKQAGFGIIAKQVSVSNQSPKQSSYV